MTDEPKRKLDLSIPEDKAEFLEALMEILATLERLSESSREIRESLQNMSEKLDSVPDLTD